MNDPGFRKGRMICCFVFAILAFCSPGLAQTSKRILIIQDDYPDEEKLLELVEVQVAQTTVPLNQPFEASNNWLNEFRIRMKNISNRSITGLSVTFHLFERIDQKLGPHESLKYVLQFKYGKNASWPKPGRKRPAIKPNQVIELGPNDIDQNFRDATRIDEDGLFSKAEFIIVMVELKRNQWRQSRFLIRRSNQ